jgi:rRNA maturation RNase YbeY
MMLGQTRLNFQTEIVVDESLDGVSLPLSLPKLRLCGTWIHQRTRGLPRRQAWKKKMGAEPAKWSILFCDDRVMRGFQRKYRKLDRTTDVLSFPTLERPELWGALKLIPRSARSLGDVILSLPAVERGARRGRRSASSELAEVLIHSYLHLLGYDHVVGRGTSIRAAREMRKIQAELHQALVRKLKLRD